MFQDIQESTNVVQGVTPALTSVPVRADNINLNNFFNYDPFDNSAISNMLPGEEIDFFLWVSHGANISSKQNFYPIETKFEAVIFYSKPYQFIGDSELVLFFTKRPCKMLTGSCPIIPIETEKKKYVHLPPLVFSLIQGDPEGLQNAMGLYYFRLKKTANQLLSMTPERHLWKDYGHVEDECIIVRSAKILNYNKMLELYQYNNITYSSIFKHVLDTCKELQISPEKVMLGLYNCQGKLTKYSSNYDQTSIRNLVPKRVDTSSLPANILPNEQFPIDTILSNTEKFFVVPASFKPNNEPDTSTWSGALAGIHHQGCALNVLNFYEFMEITAAREQAVCLSIKGTSIFRIVDLLNNTSNVFDENHSYIIARCELIYGFFVLLKLIKMMGDDASSTVFIFKLYKDLMKGDKFSQIGHTVSIYVTGGKLFYVDPQQSIFNDITAYDYNQLTSYVQGLYPFNFIDIIFFISTEKSANNIVLTDLLKSDQKVDIVQRTKDINFGGKMKRKTKSKKNRSMKNKSKRHKKQHFKTKMKTLKKKNYSKYKQYGRGDDDDDYINMVEKIDKTNKVESLILTNDEL
jgi:hypothetical protein